MSQVSQICATSPSPIAPPFDQVRARLLSVRNLNACDEEAWRDLAGRAAEPNPFYEPDCLVPAALHLLDGGSIQLLVGEEGGRFFGCMPIRDVRRWRHIPYRVATTQARRMIYSGTPLVDPTRGAEAMAAMLDALARNGPSWVLNLQETYEGGPADAAIREGVALAGLPLFKFESYERGMVQRRKGDAYEDLFRSTAQSVPRRMRRFAKEYGDAPTVVDRAEDRSAIDDYIAIEASGHKLESGNAMKLVIGEPEWFRDMCDRFRSAGRLTLPSLVAGDKLLAMNVWIHGGEGIFAIKSSFDEAYSSFGPGRAIQVLSLRYFHEATDAAWIDSTTFAGNTVLSGIYTDQRRIASYLIPLSRNPAHTATARAFIAGRPVHRRIYELRHRWPAPSSAVTNSSA